MGLKGTFRVFMNCVRISSLPSKTLGLFVSIIALAKWEELNLYQPNPGDLSTWRPQREELKVISFLAAQGPQYESAKNQLLTGVELPTLNATFSRLSCIPVEADQPEDVGETVALSATIQPSSIATRGRGRGRGSSARGGHIGIKKEGRYCDFCHKPGHPEDKCWKKFGKPDWAINIHPRKVLLHQMQLSASHSLLLQVLP